MVLSVPHPNIPQPPSPHPHPLPFSPPISYFICALLLGSQGLHDQLQRARRPRDIGCTSVHHCHAALRTQQGGGPHRYPVEATVRQADRQTRRQTGRSCQAPPPPQPAHFSQLRVVIESRTSGLAVHWRRAEVLREGAGCSLSSTHRLETPPPLPESSPSHPQVPSCGPTLDRAGREQIVTGLLGADTPALTPAHPNPSDNTSLEGWGGYGCSPLHCDLPGASLADAHIVKIALVMPGVTAPQHQFSPQQVGVPKGKTNRS